MLEFLGLDATDEAVYRLSLRRPRWSVTELATVLGLTPEEIARRWKTLLDNQLLQPDPRDPAHVLPVGPDLLMERLLAEEETRTAHRHAEIAIARAELFALVADYLNARLDLTVADHIELIEGVDNVRLRLEELARATSREVVSLYPGGAQSAASLRASTHLDLRALRQGVVMRSIYLDQIAADPPTWNYAQRLVSEGAQVRLGWQLPMRLTIIDGVIGIVPADQQASGGNALIIRGTGIVTALSALFEHCWALARPLQPDEPMAFIAGRGEDEPCEQERLLLQLLSLGLKDEAIARHLEVSVRTVRRQIAELMLRLEASSRFQAGVNAVLRGWVVMCATVAAGSLAAALLALLVCY